MDLLGEILDSLSTHSSDQGKLAAARSLDFFRSMDNIDYKAPNKSNAPSENNLVLLDGGCGDQTEWHLGQDDSALHGKHLPPSPRKRVSSGVLTESLFILTDESRDKLTRAAPEGCREAAGQAAPAAEPESQWAPPAASPTGEGKPEDTETLRQTSEDLLVPGLGRRPSTSVPWEKERGEGQEPAEGVSLLREVASLCHMSSSFPHDLTISEENASGDQA